MKDPPPTHPKNKTFWQVSVTVHPRTDATGHYPSAAR